MTDLVDGATGHWANTLEVVTRSPYWDYIELDPIRIQIQVAGADLDLLQAQLDLQTQSMEVDAAEGRRGYAIIAGQGAHHASSDGRRLRSAWMKANRSLIAATRVGVGFVIQNRLVRGALAAMFWVDSPPVPCGIHSTIAEALEQSVRMCDGASVPIPGLARRFDAAARIDLALARVTALRPAL